MSGRPRRSLGQNFLVDPNTRRRIVEAAGIGPGDPVLEIGPGRGAITEGLAEVVAREGGTLVLCEIDRDLAGELELRYRDCPEITVLSRDILTLLPEELPGGVDRLRVVGNLPYNLTSPILFHLLTPPRPRVLLVMVQKEVADRILAPPGTREYGALSVGVRTVAGVERVLTVGPGAFRPRPKVDSTVIRITPFDPPPLTAEEEHRLRTLTRACFQWRRKQLGTILRGHPDLAVPPERIEAVAAAGGARATDRPETISPEGFVAMSRAIR